MVNYYLTEKAGNLEKDLEIIVKWTTLHYVHSLRYLQWLFNLITEQGRTGTKNQPAHFGTGQSSGIPNGQSTPVTKGWEREN